MPGAGEKDVKTDRRRWNPTEAEGLKKPQRGRQIHGKRKKLVHTHSKTRDNRADERQDRQAE